MESDELTILGVDPSTTAAGLAVVEDEEVLHAETVRLGGGLMSRYCELARRIGRLCYFERPDAVAIERTYVGCNFQTAIKLATAVGAAIWAAARQVGAENVHLLYPSEIKATIAGHGQAGKKAVRDAVRLTTTGREPQTEHEADAVAAARTLGDRLRLERRAEETER